MAALRFPCWREMSGHGDSRESILNVRRVIFKQFFAAKRGRAARARRGRESWHPKTFRKGKSVAFVALCEGPGGVILAPGEAAWVGGLPTVAAPLACANAERAGKAGRRWDRPSGQLPRGQMQITRLRCV